jgi:hypothetical protein
MHPRVANSTDASIYQVMPYGVLIPKTMEDVQAAVELAAQYRLPILPRTAGSSMAGQAVNEALVIDMSRHRGSGSARLELDFGGSPRFAARPLSPKVAGGHQSQPAGVNAAPWLYGDRGRLWLLRDGRSFWLRSRALRHLHSHGRAPFAAGGTRTERRDLHCSRRGQLSPANQAWHRPAGPASGGDSEGSDEPVVQRLPAAHPKVYNAGAGECRNWQTSVT